MASNWRFTRRHWSHEDSPFHEEYSLVFASSDGEIIGYSIYKRVELEATPALYRAGAAVSAGHQCGGVYRLMSQAMLSTEWNRRPDVDEMYVAWRTRNPLIWAANARLCQAVVPSLLGTAVDPPLQDACLRLARVLFPGCSIEPPDMVMRDVYKHLTYIREPYDHVASPISAWSAGVVPDPDDAVFSVGRVRRTGPGSGG